MSKSIDLRNIERPEFFEPTPVSTKKPFMFNKRSSNNDLCFEDIESTQLKIPIRRKPVLRHRKNADYLFPVISILGKRKISAVYGFGLMHDSERYGQEIPPKFFITNTGHNIYPKEEYVAPANSLVNLYKAKIYYWREKYGKM